MARECAGCPLKHVEVDTYYDDMEEFEEVVHAHWIVDDKEGRKIWHCHCSNCKKDPQDCIGGTDDWWMVRLPHFCPNCGAKMDENEYTLKYADENTMMSAT